jgi:hypothetical protein
VAHAGADEPPERDLPRPFQSRQEQGARLSPLARPLHGTVAGNDIDNRPKRSGLACQQLRAQVALLLEWFQLSLRHGWIGSHRRRNTSQPEKLYPGKRLQQTLGARRRNELDLPQGKYAIAAGFAQPPP